MHKLLLIILAVLLASSPVLAVDPAVEQIVRSMDAKAKQGKAVEVLAEAKARVEREDNASNRYLLGRAYGMNREFEKAREQFERVLELDMSSPLAYHGLGAYYLVKGEMGEAERNLRKAIQLDDSFTRAHVELGKLLLAKQDRLAAARQFLKVLDREPDNNEVRSLLAYQYLKEKRWRKAADEFLVVLSKDAQHVGALKGLAITYAMEKKLDQAIATFEKVLTLDPKDLDAYLFLANVFRSAGKKEEAVKTLTRLLGVVPKESPIAVAVREEIKNIKSGRLPGNAPVTVPVLLEQLKTGSVEIRREAIARLSELPFAVPPPEVLRAVMDEDAVVRSIAIKWFGDVRNPRIVSLLEVLARHPRDREKNEKLRAKVSRSLGNVGDAAAIPVLLAVLVEDESLVVFRSAIQSLRDLTGLEFVEIAAEKIPESERKELTAKWNSWWRGPRAFAKKLDAIETIGDVGVRRLCWFLIELLDDAEAVVRTKAREAFGRATTVTLGTEEDLKTDEGRKDLMRRAVVILKELDQRAKAPKKPTK